MSVQSLSSILRSKDLVRLITGGFALFLVVATGSFPTYAERYRVGVEDSSYLPHFGIVDGKYSGYARDLLDAFAGDAGHQFEYVLLPVNRLLPFLADGQIDFRYPDNPNWYTAAKASVHVNYSRPLAVSVAGLSVLPKRRGRWKPQTMGILLGFNPVEDQDQIDAGSLKTSETSEMDSLVEMGLRDRVDGIYGDAYVVQHHLRSLGQVAGALVFDYSLPYSLHPYSLSTIRNSKLITNFDQWLVENTELVTRLKVKHHIQEQ